jgi:hypothetical protein
MRYADEFRDADLARSPFAIVPHLGVPRTDTWDWEGPARPAPDTIPPNRARVAADPQGFVEPWGDRMTSMWFDNLGLAMDCDGIGDGSPPPPDTRPPSALG